MEQGTSELNDLLAIARATCECCADEYPMSHTRVDISRGKPRVDVVLDLVLNNGGGACRLST